MLKMTCNHQELKLDMERTHNNSILISGDTRAGKSYLGTLLGEFFLSEGDHVQILDFNNTWNAADYARFKKAHKIEIFQTTYEIYLPNTKDFFNLARIIADSLGFDSTKVRNIIKSALKESIGMDNRLHLSSIVTWFRMKCHGPNSQKNNLYVNEVCERLDNDIIPDITIIITSDTTTPYKSAIWDFSYLSEDMARLAGFLIELGFSSSDRALILGHEVQTNEAHYSLTDKRRLEDIKNHLTKKE